MTVCSFYYIITVPLTSYFGTCPDILGKNCEFVTSRNAKSLLRNAEKGIFVLVLVFSRFYWTVVLLLSDLSNSLVFSNGLINAKLRSSNTLI